MKSFASFLSFLGLLLLDRIIVTCAFIPLETSRRIVTRHSWPGRRHRQSCNVGASFLVQRHISCHRKLHQTQNNEVSAVERLIPGRKFDKLLNKLFDKADTNRVSSL